MGYQLFISANLWERSLSSQQEEIKGCVMEEAQAHDGKNPNPNTSSSFSLSPTNRRYGPTKHHWMCFFCNYF